MSGFWMEAAILELYYRDINKTATVNQIAEEIKEDPYRAYTALEKLCNRGIMRPVIGADGLYYYSYHLPIQSKFDAECLSDSGRCMRGAPN